MLSSLLLLLLLLLFLQCSEFGEPTRKDEELRCVIAVLRHGKCHYHYLDNLKSNMILFINMVIGIYVLIYSEYNLYSCVRIITHIRIHVACSVHDLQEIILFI